MSQSAHHELHVRIFEDDEIEAEIDALGEKVEASRGSLTEDQTVDILLYLEALQDERDRRAGLSNHERLAERAARRKMQ